MSMQSSEFQSESKLIELQNVLRLSKTYKKYTIITYGNQIVCPYTLAANNFVNKQLTESAGKSSKIDSNKQCLSNTVVQRPLTVICEDKFCQKTIKFNQKPNEMSGEKFLSFTAEELKSNLSDHDEGCAHFQKGFKRLTNKDLNACAGFLLKNTQNTFEVLQAQKDSRASTLQNFSVNWDKVQQLLLYTGEQPNKENFNNFQYFKSADPSLDIAHKRLDKKLLLSLFGWKLISANALQSSLSLRCHFCHTKVELIEGDKPIPFDFFESHQKWCLIRFPEYELWKVMLRNLWATHENRSLLLSFPKTPEQIEAKQLRYFLVICNRKYLYETVVVNAIDRINSIKKKYTSGSVLEGLKECQQESSQNVEEVLSEREYNQKVKKLIATAEEAKRTMKVFIDSIKL